MRHLHRSSGKQAAASRVGKQTASAAFSDESTAEPDWLNWTSCPLCKLMCARLRGGLARRAEAYKRKQQLGRSDVGNK